MADLIGIIDYGLSNLACVQAAVGRLGFETLVGGTPDVVERATKIILPGVGAFGDAMRNMRDRDLVSALNHQVNERGKPFLGICLGAQLVAKGSDEFGEHEGLGWIDAHVRRLSSLEGLRVPHTGWDDLEQVGSCTLFEGIPGNALFYYTHSHGIFCEDDEVVAGICNYGQRIVSVLQKGNIFATQFHPEKSQRFGLLLLQNFLAHA